MRGLARSKKFQVELDEIENGFEISLYQGNDYRRIYAKTLDEAIAVIKKLNQQKGKKKA